MHVIAKVIDVANCNKSYTEPPISPNPSFVRNATHLSLILSPPFLWPGHRIDFYNISVTQGTNGNTDYYNMNSTYDAKMVTFTLDISEPHQSMISCSNITFNIVAFKKFSSLPAILQVSEWTWTFPSCKLHALIHTTS